MGWEWKCRVQQTPKYKKKNNHQKRHLKKEILHFQSKNCSELQLAQGTGKVLEQLPLENVGILWNSRSGDEEITSVGALPVLVWAGLRGNPKFRMCHWEFIQFEFLHKEFLQRRRELPQLWAPKCEFFVCEKRKKSSPNWIFGVGEIFFFLTTQISLLYLKPPPLVFELPLINFCSFVLKRNLNLERPGSSWASVGGKWAQNNTWRLGKAKKSSPKIRINLISTKSQAPPFGAARWFYCLSESKTRQRSWGNDSILCQMLSLQPSQEKLIPVPTLCNHLLPLWALPSVPSWHFLAKE